MIASKVIACRGCGADIRFITTKRGKSHPIDADPVRLACDDGDVIEGRIPAKIWFDDGSGSFDLVTGFPLTGENGRNACDTFEGYRSHFVTCPQADNFRSPRT